MREGREQRGRIQERRMANLLRNRNLITWNFTTEAQRVQRNDYD
jgi:hypothetical protein